MVNTQYLAGDWSTAEDIPIDQAESWLAANSRDLGQDAMASAEGSPTNWVLLKAVLVADNPDAAIAIPNWVRSEGSQAVGQPCCPGMVVVVCRRAKHQRDALRGTVDVGYNTVGRYPPNPLDT